MPFPDLPVPLHPASHQSQSILGPFKTAAQRIADHLDQIDALCAKVRDLGGHDALFAQLAETLAEMRLDGEALKKAAGLPSAFDALPCVRETDAMLARELPAFV